MCIHTHTHIYMHVYACLHAVMSNSSVTPCIVACQAPLSTGFPRQEYFSELPFLSPWDLPDSRSDTVSPDSPALQADFSLLSHQGSISINNDNEKQLVLKYVNLHRLFSHAIPFPSKYFSPSLFFISKYISEVKSTIYS